MVRRWNAWVRRPKPRTLALRRRQPLSQTAGGDCVRRLSCGGEWSVLTARHSGGLWQINEPTWLTACHADSGAWGAPSTPPERLAAQPEIWATVTVLGCDMSCLRRIILYDYSEYYYLNWNLLFSMLNHKHSQTLLSENLQLLTHIATAFIFFLTCFSWSRSFFLFVFSLVFFLTNRLSFYFLIRT